MCLFDLFGLEDQDNEEKEDLGFSGGIFFFVKNSESKSENFKNRPSDPMCSIPKHAMALFTRQIKIMMESQVKVMRKQGKLREGTAEWGAIIHK